MAEPPDRGKVVTGITELLTPSRRLEGAAMAVADGHVSWLGPAADLPRRYRSWPRSDLGGRGVLPGLVDSHTHLVWAGSRVEEYRRRSHGADYLEILEAGGGIHATVTATRRADPEALFELASKRAGVFLAGGVTTLEVKSGYGLEPQQELKLLEVVRRLGRERRQRFVPTLLAHVVPDDWERGRYLDMLVQELIPEVARRGLAVAVDVFCDRGAFTLGESRRILEAARERGLGVKAHAEQLDRLGAARLVAELGGLSADHLEASTPEDWRALAAAGTVATLLPGAALLLGKALPDGAAMLASGLTVAVASDHNPGSSPLFGLLPALQLALSWGGLSCEQALSAGTSAAADALGRPRLGRLEPGSAADFVVVAGPEALLPLYTWGTPSIEAVFIAGTRCWRAAR